MEQPSRRNEFIKTLFIKTFVEMVLTDRILSYLYEDIQNPYFELMPALRLLPDENSKKTFILTKYTEERDSVIYLAEVMIQNNQPKIAEYLETYNKSADLIPYVYDNSLEVIKAKLLRGRKGESMRFRMDLIPKGICILVLNESQLEREAQQMRSVFIQLGFEVMAIRKDQTSAQINQLFDEVSTQEKYKNYNSLVTIMIGHGINGHFQGSDPNPVDRFVSIPELIDKFAISGRNFNRDTNKAKIHIFNCCRSRTYDEDLVKLLEKSTLSERLEKFKTKWVNNNANTTIIYSCADGQDADYLFTIGFSIFGRALTHTLAQFSCEQHLSELLATMIKRLKFDGEYQAPEIITFCTEWKLYFNPGLPLK